MRLRDGLLAGVGGGGFGFANGHDLHVAIADEFTEVAATLIADADAGDREPRIRRGDAFIPERLRRDDVWRNSSSADGGCGTSQKLATAERCWGLHGNSSRGFS